jgi:hypothetical protein
MQLISTVSVGAGGASTINFGSIPQTFTDLLLVTSLRDNNNSVVDYAGLQFNGITTGFTSLGLEGTGNSTSRTSRGTFWLPINGDTSTAGQFGNSSLYIFNYTSSTVKVLNVDSTTSTFGLPAITAILANAWSGTAAITSITLYGAGVSFMQNSAVSLYGILRGSGGATVS